MERLQRISWALVLLAAGCGDDVSSPSDGSTGGDAESSTGATVDPTNVTTTINPTGSTSTGDDTTGDPETSSTSDESTTGSTTDETSSSSSDGGSSSSTGDPVDCGNGVLDEGEDCDGDDLGDATCQSLDMGFTGGVLACEKACGFDTAACTSVMQPAVGEVIISEIMPDPTTIPDSDGEWFELHNPSPTETYQLSGCEISGQVDEDVIVLEEDLLIGPGEYVSFAPMSIVEPGFTPGYQWTVNYFVGNNGDIITLSCGGTVVDTVDYDAFPPGPGVSLNLDPDFFDATANDDGANWCDGVNEYLPPDTGTPGAANDECVDPEIYTIGFCRMQFPDTIVEDAGTSVDVFGRLFIAGLTDMSTSNDLAPEVSGQVGYGPDGTDPSVDGGWTWVDAVPNAGYTAVAEPNNDEYMASLTVPAPGEYDYAYRFSGDSGASYTYCDGMAAGNSDGYQPENAGQMTSNGDVVAPDSLVLAEVYYDHIGADAGFTWAKLFNGTGADIDLSSYSIGWGGTSYTSGGVQLSGTIAAGACFLLGGPNGDVDSGFSDPPMFDLEIAFDPQNSGPTADGIALFDVVLADVAGDTTPIDAVIYGGANTNNLIDETGAAPAPDVGDALNGDSIILLSDGTWVIQADPTPTLCAFAG